MAGVFLADVKCCTYHPWLANFKVGNVLSRGGPGAERIRLRLENLEGVHSDGIHAPPGWTERYEAQRAEGFGRDAGMVCPYWVPGPLNCSVWEDRAAVCQTWFCRHEQGHRGHRLWTALRKLHTAFEHAEAERIAGEVAFEGDWGAYFEHCADRERPPPLDSALVIQARSELEAPLPDVLAPYVRQVTEVGENIRIVGYTPWDPVVFPRSVFALLAAFDGERTVSEALELARATDASIELSWVERLFAIDALRAPEAGTPWGFEGPDLIP